MAKKHVGKKLKLSKNISPKNKTLFWLYDSGCLHSVIFHTIFFLILSLFSVHRDRPKLIKLSVSFNAQDSIESVDLTKIQSIELINNTKDSRSISDFESFSPVSVNEETIVSQPDINSEHIYTSVTENLNLKDLIQKININKKDIQKNDFADEVGVKKGGSLPQNIDSSNNIISDISRSIGNGGLQAGLSGKENDEFGKRLDAAGAKSGDIQISIMWNTIDDIDLHVTYTPGNGMVDNINWTNRIGRLSAGMLDVDRNATSNSITQTPVENIFWQKNSSPKGFFIVGVHFYRSWTGNNKVPVIARIKHGDVIQEMKAIAILYQSPQEIYRFRFPN